jgi:hypothetical protein
VLHGNNLYLPNPLNEIKEYEIHWNVMFILGEIAFHKHMREINLHQIPLEPVGLLPLIELPY